ncbi:MAG TPA: hypothetical protein PK659_02160 [Methanothrix sp.]|mgnify:CR=1 FL=1|uniref:hypothetical protein n=1 Tax=Methanothrix sp. TaxID=90426 RepID=UPI002C20833E|nr:hypothetical protein [Methanothrix sp.]HOK58141.1 hypothetical protein [Methanothrix sp.]HOL43045.1 hypothetical protein [Methanothrix sp.]HPO88048.1 hypothetical protein [Methanothrix sp.]
MKHPDRIFSYMELESEDELVKAITEHTWPLCYGFYHGDLLYLGDGDSEDAQEYSVVRIERTEGHHGIVGTEVGRIASRNKDEVRRIIREMKAGVNSMSNPIKVQVEPKWHHSCQLCRLEED